MVEENKKMTSGNTRYEEYLNLAGSMILALDKNGVITYINNKGCEILGFGESEIIGKTWIEHFIPKQSHDEIEEIRKAVMSLKPGDRDYKEGQVIASDGRIKWISWSNSGLFDDEGRLIGTLSSGEDITEKKENEKKLLENENRLKDSEAMSHTGHWVRDLKTGKYIFSDEMYRIFGLDRRIKLIYADLLHEKFHPDDAQGIIEYTEGCLIKGKDYTFEGRLLLSGNKVKHIKASVKINKDEKGNPISAKGVMSDVTETVLFEQELIKNELQLKKAEEIAKVGSFIQDLRTNEYICSDGFLNICGFADSGAKVDFTKAIGVTHPDDKDYIQKIIAESLKTGSDYEFENRIIRPDGEIRYVRSKGTYIKNENGVPIKSMGTLLDITEYKKNENRLLESQRRLKMAEIIAHIGHWERDYETGVSFWSDEVYRILGSEPQGFVASEKEYVNYIHPDDYAKFTEDSQKAVSGEIPYDIESRIIDANGAVKFIRIIGNRILKDGDLSKTFGTIEDITSEKLYEEELLKKTRTLENAEAIAHIGHWERDFVNDSMYWSDEIYRIIGFEPGDFEVYPNKDREFIHPDDWDELQKYYLKTRNDGTPFEIDVRAYKRTGEEIVIKIKGGVTSGENEGLVISGTIEDITELKKYYDEIEYMNYHDPLTGLYNRRYFDEQFGKIDNNENYPISVIIADINGLKMINDDL